MKKFLIFTLMFTLVAPASAQLEQNEIPTIFNIETTSPLPGVVEVTWATSFNTTGCVKYGTATTNEDQVCNQSQLTTGDHKIVLEDLNPGGKYKFQIVAINGFGQEFETIVMSFHVRGEKIILDTIFITPGMTTAEISFVSDYPCKAQVDYGEKNMPGYDTVEELAWEEEHDIILPGLIQDTLYRYRIRCTDDNDIIGYYPEQEDFWNEFRTVADPNAPSQQEPLTLEEIQEQEFQTIHERRIEVIKRERIYSVNLDPDFTRQQAGRILLQVEERGEAWYVSRTKMKRIYLADGNDAQQLLRDEGEGITDADLAKIPVDISTHIPDADRDGDGLSDRIEIALGTNQNLADSDGDGYDDRTELLNGFSPLGSGRPDVDKTYAKSQGGKIFLQVQQNGEAWYVHPDTEMRYYLATAEDAYQVMRELSLGITNENIRRIDVLQ